MNLAQYSLYYPFIFSFLLLIIASVHSARVKKWVWLIITFIVVILLSGSVVQFLIGNIGKGIAFDKFDFRGLWVSEIVGGIVAVAGLIIWWRQKAKYPGLVVTLLSVIHVFLLLFVMFYHSR